VRIVYIVKILKLTVLDKGR